MWTGDKTFLNVKTQDQGSYCMLVNKAATKTKPGKIPTSIQFKPISIIVPVVSVQCPYQLELPIYLEADHFVSS